MRRANRAHAVLVVLIAGSLLGLPGVARAAESFVTLPATMSIETTHTDGEFVVWSHTDSDTGSRQLTVASPRGPRPVTVVTRLTWSPMPALSDGVLIWAEQARARPEEPTLDVDIRGLNLRTGESFVAAATHERDEKPALDGERLVWIRSNPDTGPHAS